VRRRVDRAKSTLDQKTGDDTAGGSAGRMASSAASSAQPAAERIRQETTKRPWPMLAAAFAAGLVIGRRLG
jgi:hypothetical protein